MTPAYLEYAFEAPALAPLVCSAWGQAYGDAGLLPGVIAPDAHVEIVFQLGEPCTLLRNGEETAPPRALVLGLRHGALQMKATGANTMVALRLSPVVASVVLGSPLARRWDQAAPLADYIGGEAEQLLDQLSATPLQRAGAVLEAWLVRRLSEWSAQEERQARLQSVLMWRSIDEPVSRLADRLGYTERTLRRHCETYAGLSPKQLMMSGRMLQACDLLVREASMPLAQAAYQLGFSDQSAFSNAFKRYLGMTPRELRQQPLVHYQTPRWA